MLKGLGQLEVLLEFVSNEKIPFLSRYVPAMVVRCHPLPTNIDTTKHTYIQHSKRTGYGRNGLHTFSEQVMSGASGSFFFTSSH